MESETSPGSLLSTGYIAGGAIAGVLIAFLSFNDTIPGWLATWQYRTVTFEREEKFDDAVQRLAQRPEGLKTLFTSKVTGDEVKEAAAEIGELNTELKPRLLPGAGPHHLEIARRTDV